MDAGRTQSALQPWRVAIARLMLGLIESRELPPIADELLKTGVYSPSLAEIATARDPIMSDIHPLVFNTAAELGIKYPSISEAAWMLPRHNVEVLAAGCEYPYPILDHLRIAQFNADCSLRLEGNYLGSSLDIDMLLGLYHSYNCPNVNFYHTVDLFTEGEDERIKLLGTLVQREAIEWLKRHPESTAS